MVREFISRVGIFMILVGLGVLILFIASSGAGAANFDYLFWAMLALIGGFLLRGRRESPPSGERFSVLRRLRGSTRNRREHR